MKIPMNINSVECTLQHYNVAVSLMRRPCIGLGRDVHFLAGHNIEEYFLYVGYYYHSIIKVANTYLEIVKGVNDEG